MNNTFKMDPRACLPDLKPPRETDTELLKRIAFAFDEWHKTPDQFVSEELLDALGEAHERYVTPA